MTETHAQSVARLHATTPPMSAEGVEAAARFLASLRTPLELSEAS